MRVIPRRLRIVLLAVSAFGFLAAYGCGGNVVLDPGASTSTSGGGIGGAGGVPNGACPSTAPVSGFGCTVLGQTCTYQSSGSGIVTQTLCECSSGGWSCGSEGVAVGGGG